MAWFVILNQKKLRLKTDFKILSYHEYEYGQNCRYIEKKWISAKSVSNSEEEFLLQNIKRKNWLYLEWPYVEFWLASLKEWHFLITRYGIFNQITNLEINKFANIDIFFNSSVYEFVLNKVCSMKITNHNFVTKASKSNSARLFGKVPWYENYNTKHLNVNQSTKIKSSRILKA